MRLISLILVALFLFCAGPVFAQGYKWTTYVSKEDGFSISFPGQPKIQDITYPSEYRIDLPGRVHAFVDGPRRYAVTVVDYRNAIKLHLARNKACTDAGGDGDQCQDEGPKEIRGALVWASWNFMQGKAKVTHYAHYNIDLVEGHELHLLNPDGSLTHVAIHMHEDRLYIIEATVPKGEPPPNLFQISTRFLDSQGNPVRYSWVGSALYSNGYPPPPRAGQGGRGQGQGQQGGRGQKPADPYAR